jgi:hypothetical protein
MSAASQGRPCRSSQSEILVSSPLVSWRDADRPPQVRLGRVEDGRGSLGLLANTPFPITAHRTARAELPHPGLRLASLQAHDEAHQGRPRCCAWAVRAAVSKAIVLESTSYKRRRLHAKNNVA